MKAKLSKLKRELLMPSAGGGGGGGGKCDFHDAAVCRCRMLTGMMISWFRCCPYWCCECVCQIAPGPHAISILTWTVVSSDFPPSVKVL